MRMFRAIYIIFCLLLTENSFTPGSAERLNFPLIHRQKRQNIEFGTPNPESRRQSCITRAGDNGKCIPVSQCSTWNRRDRPCGFERDVPLVCCKEKQVTISRLTAVVCGVRPFFPIGNVNRRKKRDDPILEDPEDGDFQISVVGGDNAVPNSWPWMVALDRRISNTNSRILCGASLISKIHVLTAAHCFTKRETTRPSSFSVRVGAHTQNDGTRYQVKSITVHPDYKSSVYYHDIAILTLTERVPISPRIMPVCLPDPQESAASLRNKMATVLGWGDTSFGGVSSVFLQEAYIPVIATRDCNSDYSKVASTQFPRGISNEFLCAGYSEGGKDSCQGDSGGPLLLSSGNTWKQIGIVSFGYNCADPGFPGVYTRVSNYIQWINNVTEGLKDSV